MTCKWHLSEVYPVAVCAKTIGDLFAQGKYDDTNVKPGILAKHYPVRKDDPESAGLRYIHFNKRLRSEDALYEISKCGLRSATIRYLLAFGAAFPDIQRQFSLIAFDLCAGLVGQDMPCLDAWGKKRRFRMLWSGFPLNERCRFLVFE